MEVRVCNRVPGGLFDVLELRVGDVVGADQWRVLDGIALCRSECGAWSDCGWARISDGSFGELSVGVLGFTEMVLPNHVWFRLSTEFMKSTRKALDRWMGAKHTRT